MHLIACINRLLHQRPDSTDRGHWRQRAQRATQQAALTGQALGRSLQAVELRPQRGHLLRSQKLGFDSQLCIQVHRLLSSARTVASIT